MDMVDHTAEDFYKLEIERLNKQITELEHYKKRIDSMKTLEYKLKEMKEVIFTIESNLELFK